MGSDRAAEVDHLGFWAKQANRLSWQTPFSEVLDWSEAPFAKWFADGDVHAWARSGDWCWRRKRC